MSRGTRTRRARLMAATAMVVVGLVMAVSAVVDWDGWDGWLADRRDGRLSRRLVLSPTVATGLVTNEYATYHPASSDAVTSADWAANSGSLFARDGLFWSGSPDSCLPDATSSQCTNSNVFRMSTRESFSGRTTVTLAVRQNQPLADATCAARGACWHGVHVWLRFQGEANLYYVSLQRADGMVVIKRKVPCGQDNEGTYIDLSQYVPHGYVEGEWQHFSVTIQTRGDGSVAIELYDTDHDPDHPVVTGVDRGGVNPQWRSDCQVAGAYLSADYPPLTDQGPVGVRGDFADFSFGPVSISDSRSW